MPAVSDKQQKAMAIALHNPQRLYSRNSSMKDMSQDQLHDFASTTAPEMKKPKRVVVMKKSGK